MILKNMLVNNILSLNHHFNSLHIVANFIIQKICLHKHSMIKNKLVHTKNTLSHES